MYTIGDREPSFGSTGPVIELWPYSRSHVVEVVDVEVDDIEVVEMMS